MSDESQRKTSDLPAEESASRVRTYALPSLAVVSGIGVLEILRSRFQHGRLFLPDRYPNGIWEPSTYGVPAIDRWFEAEDGVRLHGWWIPHRRATGTVLFCHGNSGSIAHLIGFFRYLRRFRINVFAFDYRGYGRSEGEPTEKGVCRDVRAAFDEVTARLDQPRDRVILFGHSLGGAVAIDAAVHRPAAGLIVQSSFVDVREMARSLFGQVPLHWIARNQFRSIEKISRLTMPKLVIHGTEDGTIPHHHGERLFEAAPEPKRFLSVVGAGHNDVYRHGGISYFWNLSRFFRSCLRKESAR